MALKQITAPAVKPITLAEVEAQVRADLTAESALVELYIAAATAKAENLIKRALITQTWELSLDCFPYKLSTAGNALRICGISLPFAPVQSITSIKYVDIDGVQQTLSAADYVLTSDDPNCVVPAYGKSWPSTRMQPESVIIRYVAGYGLAANIPEAIKAWILLNVGNLYENRETIITDKSQYVELNTMADSLLDSYRLVSF